MTQVHLGIAAILVALGHWAGFLPSAKEMVPAGLAERAEIVETGVEVRRHPAREGHASVAQLHVDDDPPEAGPGDRIDESLHRRH